jgi:hypothetical protein
MRKGTTALRNIPLLKWGRQYGVVVEWNILYGFPGETREDYDAMMKLLPSIRFLNPPSACGPIRIDRFSPYFNSPAEFGLLNVRPIAPYKYLYPFDAGCLQRIAYYFDHDYAPGVDPRGSAEEVINYVREWQQNPEAGMLCYTYREDGALVLLDSRSGRTMPELALTGLEKAAYEYCNDLRSAGAVARHLREVFPDVQFADRQVIDFLDSLVSNRLMVSDGSHYLSLAIAAYPAHKTDDEALIQAGVAGYAVRQADARPSPQLNSFDV